MSRFDYVAYDETATAIQGGFKTVCQNLEKTLESMRPGRAQSLAITKLEEFYMWVGKAIRDDQIGRNGSAPLQEGRKNG